MITAQDIRDKIFDKARIGGYDMASVDDFLEELADSVAASQKENTVLKSKMKVLVDKIEEYRANEEALNMAVLSAQKLAVQIESDARTRAAAMIAEAEEKSRAVIGSISDQREYEERRLAAAKETYARFVSAARDMCNKQLSNLDKISGASQDVKPAPAPAAVEAPAPSASLSIEEAVRSIENSVAHAQPQPSINIDVASAMDVPASSYGYDSTQTFSL